METEMEVLICLKEAQEKKSCKQITLKKAEGRGLGRITSHLSRHMIIKLHPRDGLLDIKVGKLKGFTTRCLSMKESTYITVNGLMG